MAFWSLLLLASPPEPPPVFGEDRPASDAVWLRCVIRLPNVYENAGLESLSGADKGVTKAKVFTDRARPILDALEAAQSRGDARSIVRDEGNGWIIASLRPTAYRALDSKRTDPAFPAFNIVVERKPQVKIPPGEETTAMPDDQIDKRFPKDSKGTGDPIGRDQNVQFQTLPLSPQTLTWMLQGASFNVTISEIAKDGSLRGVGSAKSVARLRLKGLLQEKKQANPSTQRGSKPSEVSVPEQFAPKKLSDEKIKSRFPKG
jgi:hypothetical protein